VHNSTVKGILCSIAALSLVALAGCGGTKETNEPAPSSTAAPQPEQPSQPAATDAKVTVEVLTPEVKASENARVVVRVEVPEGLHAYTPEVGGSYRPLRIDLKDGPVDMLKPEFPKGELKQFPGLSSEPLSVYEGRVEVPVEVSLSRGVKGDVTVTLTVETQLCSDEVCYPPNQQEVTFTVKVN
jgi:DsbC/DsbD-like thiol-disulfide interchange protein